MTKVFKIDINENIKLKCGTKFCQTRRHKRSLQCQLHAKKWNDIYNPVNSPVNNAKALNTDNKVWSVYRINLDGYVYYGQTGVQITRRAHIHRNNAQRGIHKDSYIHQQIIERNMTRAEVAKLMDVLCIARTKEESLAIESHLIKKAVLRGEKVCNNHGVES